MANTSYDTLTITINADSSQAIADIGKLSTSLNRLNKTAQNLDTARITEVKKLLQGIAKIDFSKVSQGLQDIVKAFNAFSSKSFMKATAGGENMSGAYKDMEKEAQTYVPNFTMQDQLPATLEDVKNRLGDLRDPLRVFRKELEDTLREAGFNAEQVRIILSAFNKEIREISPEQLEEIKNILIGMGMPAERVDKVIKSLSKDVEKLDGSAKKGSNGLKKLLNQFGKIMKYRIIRKLIQEIYKALTGGLQNVAMADDKTNESLSNIKATLQLITDAIGSLVAPIIQLLEPVLVTLGDTLAKITDEWAQYFSAMAGNDTYQKATKNIKDYRKELQKTANLGIDELNVIQKQDNNFVETPIDPEIIEKTKEFKENWDDVVKVVEDVSELVYDLNSQSLEPTIKLLGVVASLLLDIYDILSPILNPLTKVINFLLGKIVDIIAVVLGYVDKIIKKLKPYLKPLAQFIGDLITTIGEGLGGAIEAIMGAWGTAFEFISAVFQTFVLLFKGDTDEIGAVWENLGLKLETLWAGIGEFFVGVWENIKTRFAGIGEWFVGVWENVKSVFGDVCQGIKDAFTSVGDWFVSVWEGIKDVFGKFASWFVDTGKAIGDGFKTAWNGIVNAVITVLNAVIGAIETFINWIVGGIANIASYFGVDTSGWYVSFGRIAEYATGGFPEDGLFMANHNELVGKFNNGQTAVANNEQIIEGIKQGVMEAMKESSGAQEIIINLDSYEIARAVNNRNRNMGEDLVVGSNLIYGK